MDNGGTEADGSDRPDEAAAAGPDPARSELDLREASPDPASTSVTIAAPGPDPVGDDDLDAPVTLATLAFRLFSTIENQMARDPHGSTLTALATRLDVLERGVATAISRADELAEIGEQLTRIDEKLAAPNPLTGPMAELRDRVAAAEHQLATPQPQRETIASLVERVEALETGESETTLPALDERVAVIENRLPQAMSHIADQMGSFERRLPSPEVIAGLAVRIERCEERVGMLEDPAPHRPDVKRVVLNVIALAILLGAVAVIAILAAG